MRNRVIINIGVALTCLYVATSIAGCSDIKLIEEPDEIPMETICRR